MLVLGNDHNSQLETLESSNRMRHSTHSFHSCVGNLQVYEFSGGAINEEDAHQRSCYPHSRPRGHDQRTHKRKGKRKRIKPAKGQHSCFRLNRPQLQEASGEPFFQETPQIQNRGTSITFVPVLVAHIPFQLGSIDFQSPSIQHSGLLPSIKRNSRIGDEV